MLVLSRKKGEKIVFSIPPENLRLLAAAGAELRFSVCMVEIRGDKVRLGADCPSEITIHREEIQTLIDTGNGREKR